jgi:hypothetical protein
MLTEIAQCLPDIGEAQLVLPTNGIQYMEFHDIHEGNQGAVRMKRYPSSSRPIQLQVSQMYEDILHHFDGWKKEDVTRGDRMLGWTAVGARVQR